MKSAQYRPTHGGYTEMQMILHFMKDRWRKNYFAPPPPKSRHVKKKKTEIEKMEKDLGFRIIVSDAFKEPVFITSDKNKL